MFKHERVFLPPIEFGARCDSAKRKGRMKSGPQSIQTKNGLSPALVVLIARHDDVRDETRGDSGQNILVVRLDPLITARRLSQVIILPVGNDMLIVVPVLGRKPIATRPMRIVANLIAVLFAALGLVSVGALIVVLVLVAPLLVIVAILRLLARRRAAVSVGGTAIVLRQCGRTAEQRQSHGNGCQVFHGEFLGLSAERSKRGRICRRIV